MTLILSVIVAVAPLPSALHKLWETLFNLRSHLKEDLEILKLIDPKDPAYTVVKKHVDRTIAERYGPPGPFSRASWAGMLGGLTGCVFMILWTIKLRTIGARPSSWVTGALAVVFFSQFAANLWDRTLARRERAPEKAPAAEPVADA